MAQAGGQQAGRNKEWVLFLDVKDFEV